MVVGGSLWDAKLARCNVGAEEREVVGRRGGGLPLQALAVGAESAALARPVEMEASVAGRLHVTFDVCRKQGVSDQTLGVVRPEEVVALRAQDCL